MPTTYERQVSTGPPKQEAPAIEDVLAQLQREHADWLNTTVNLAKQEEEIGQERAELEGVDSALESTLAQLKDEIKQEGTIQDQEYKQGKGRYDAEMERIAQWSAQQAQAEQQQRAFFPKAGEGGQVPGISESAGWRWTTSGAPSWRQVAQKAAQEAQERYFPQAEAGYGQRRQRYAEAAVNTELIAQQVAGVRQRQKQLDAEQKRIDANRKIAEAAYKIRVDTLVGTSAEAKKVIEEAGKQEQERQKMETAERKKAEAAKTKEQQLKAQITEAEKARKRDLETLTQVMKDLKTAEGDKKIELEVKAEDIRARLTLRSGLLEQKKQTLADIRAGIVGSLPSAGETEPVGEIQLEEPSEFTLPTDEEIQNLLNQMLGQ